MVGTDTAICRCLLFGRHCRLLSVGAVVIYILYMDCSEAQAKHVAITAMHHRIKGTLMTQKEYDELRLQQQKKETKQRTHQDS